MWQRKSVGKDGQCMECYWAEMVCRNAEKILEENCTLLWVTDLGMMVVVVVLIVVVVVSVFLCHCLRFLSVSFRYDMVLFSCMILDVSSHPPFPVCCVLNWLTDWLINNKLVGFEAEKCVCVCVCVCVNLNFKYCSKLRRVTQAYR